MKTSLTYWTTALSDAKNDAKASGVIKGDADLAAKTSEILEAAGYPEVQRTAVNHWINGRNPPPLSSFIALCMALGVSPTDMLKSDGMVKLVRLQKRLPKASKAKAMSILDRLDEDEMVRAGEILEAAFPMKQIENRRKL